MGEAAPLTEDELAAIEALLRRRDHAALARDTVRAEIHMALADEVPALCAEVRRVWAFCDSLRPLVAEVGRLRAIEAAARKLLTLDVADPVARAIALAVIASGLREALGLGSACDKPR